MSLLQKRTFIFSSDLATDGLAAKKGHFLSRDRPIETVRSRMEIRRGLREALMNYR